MTTQARAESTVHLLPAISAGLIAGVVAVILQISFAALVFSGELAPFVSRGIGMALYGACAIGLVGAFLSSYPGTVSLPQSVPMAILGLTAGAIVAAMPEATPEAKLATVLVAIATTSLCAGLFFVVLGVLRLGRLIRFVPYPVIGGFLAGTGWLLVRGAVRVMLEGEGPVGVLSAPALARWLPGLAIGAALLFLMRRIQHYLVLPVATLGAILLFYAAAFLGGGDVASLTASGWLLGEFPSALLWSPLTPSLIHQADWSVVLGSLSGAGTLLAISTVALLLNASGMELAADTDIDFDRELRSAGVGNLLSAGGGGPVGYLSLTLSMMSARVGARTRLVGVVAALVCATAALAGAGLFSYLPRPVLGGLLVFIGLDLLVQWLMEAYRRLPRNDYLLIVLITITISAVGFLEGVGAGVVIALVLFATSYSRVNVVKHALSGASFRSNVERAHEERGALDASGQQVWILELHGFLFFGTANGLLNRVRARVDDASQPTLRFLVLDFRLVTGIDSSAVYSFLKMRRLAESQGFVLVFALDDAEILKQMEASGFHFAEHATTPVFGDLDRAVEWCEDRILSGAALTRFARDRSLHEVLMSLLPPDADAERLERFFERQEVAQGTVLIEQGKPVEALYFVESGRVTVRLVTDRGEPARLRDMGAGTVVGEIGLYLGQSASAQVVAGEDSVLCRLSADALARMEAEAPEVAAAFHKLIARLLGERVVHSNQILRALLD